MKKKITLLTFVVLLACLSLNAKQVTVATAQKVANNFLSGSATTRSNTTTGVQLVHTEKETSTRSTSGQVSNYYYIFNVGNDNGFVIISADDTQHPIIGYTTKGKYTVEEQPNNFKSWMQSVSTGIKNTMATRSTTSNQIKTEWDAYLAGKVMETRAAKEVPQLLKTEWSQDSPYNIAIASMLRQQNIKAGCVAINMAQIIKYYEHPKAGKGTTKAYKTRNGKYTILALNLAAAPFDWGNMLNKYTQQNSNITQAYAVGQLIGLCGASVEMNYDTSSSDAYSDDAVVAMNKYFDYQTHKKYSRNKYTAAGWSNLYKAELDAGRPIYDRGSSDGTLLPGVTSGHAFVCDGYNKQSFFHVNFGWGGTYNGYYAIDKFGFSDDREAYMNLQPNAVLSFSKNLSVNTYAGLGEKIAVSTFLKNSSKGSFEGRVGVVLVDKSGKQTIISEKTLTIAKNATNNGSFSCQIPFTTKGGIYQVRVVYKNNSRGEWITIPSNKTIQILEGITQTCASLFSTQTTDVKYKNTRYANGIYIVNFSNKEFSGYFSPVLVNTTGKIYCHLATNWKVNTELKTIKSGARLTFGFYTVTMPNITGTYTYRLAYKAKGQSNWQLLPLVPGKEGQKVVINNSKTKTAFSDLPSTEATLKVYPNPASDVLNIESPSELKRVKLISIMGQTVITEEAQGTSKALGIDKLPSGTYIIQIETEEGITTQKIIKK